MKIKDVFKSKKNIAITALSILLIGTAGIESSTSADLAKSEEKVEQLTAQLKEQKAESLAAQVALADFQEKNEEFIEVGKKEVKKLKKILKETDEAFENLEKDNTQEAYDTASEKINLLTDEQNKAGYLKRLELAKTIIEAEKSVTDAEKEVKQEKLDSALSKVKALASSDKKEQLEKRLDTVKTNLEKKKTEEKLAQVEEAVKNLENNQTRENITGAQNQVNSLEDDKQKENFNTRIKAVTSAIESREAQEQAATQQAAQAAQDQSTTTVYITATGKRYHLSPNCRGLNNSKSTSSTTLSDAEARGLTLCQFE